eukprot:scaffold477_cov35-Phaeocystis_antarctica.AAC.1
MAPLVASTRVPGEGSVVRDRDRVRVRVSERAWPLAAQVGEGVEHGHVGAAWLGLGLGLGLGIGP